MNRNEIMSKNGILWTVAAVVVLVFSLAQPLLTGAQPVSGTIGIEGKKISYYFPREVESGEDYQFLIRNDNQKVTGYFLYQMKDGKEIKKELKISEGTLTGVIPSQAPGSLVSYTVFLRYGDKETQIPYKTTVQTGFTGKVSIIIKVIYPFFLFLGLLLACRGGLEYFNPTPKFKLYTIFTTIFFICFGFFIVPVKNFMLLAPAPGVVLEPSAMFNLESLFYPLFWIIISILVFFRVKSGLVLLAGSILTIAGFILLG